jgi:hypothetical protein
MKTVVLVAILVGGLTGLSAQARPQVFPLSRTVPIQGVSSIDGIAVRAVAVRGTNVDGTFSTNYALAAQSTVLVGYVEVAPTVQDCRLVKVRQLLADIESAAFPDQTDTSNQSHSSNGGSSYCLSGR